MANIRFSKLPKHRKFNYMPIYYDEQKEELHARVNDIKREMGWAESKENSVQQNIHRAYKAKQSNHRYGKLASAQKFYTLRIVIIALVLGLIFYNLWNSNVLEFIFGGLSK